MHEGAGFLDPFIDRRYTCLCHTPSISIGCAMDIRFRPDVRSALGARVAVEITIRKGEEEFLPRWHRPSTRRAIEVGRRQLVELSGLTLGGCVRCRCCLNDSRST